MELTSLSKTTNVISPCTWHPDLVTVVDELEEGQEKKIDSPGGNRPKKPYILSMLQHQT